LKTITGCLAILLGGVGALVTLALIGAVWWGAFKLPTQVKKVTDQADQSLAQIEDAFDRLLKQTEATASALDKVRARVRTETSTDALQRVRGDLLPLVERADAAHDALPSIAKMIDDSANLAEQAGNKARADRLRAIAGSVRAAADRLDSVRDRAAEVRQGRSPTAKNLTGLAQETHGALDSLTAALSGVKEETGKLRKDVPQVQQALDEWKLPGAGIATGVLFWVGLGQLAIVAWGRRRLAARSAAPPPAGAAPPR
jgi:TM2 domain-containing membrane protein YozV